MERVTVNWPESKLYHNKKMFVVDLNDIEVCLSSDNRIHYPEIRILKEKVIFDKTQIKILCIMQNAWGSYNLQDIPYFRINPRNKSGKRMLDICNDIDNDIYFANVCPQVFDHSKLKGKTDLNHTRKILFAQNYDLYIVCGVQAKEALRQIDCNGLIKKSIIYTPHPASRSLTNKLCHEIKSFISQESYQKHRITEFKQLKGSFEIEHFTNFELV